MSRLCVVAAGGTGGHLFPAQALAEALTARGWRVALATDDRGASYASNFPAERRTAGLSKLRAALCASSSLAAARARACSPN